MHMHSMIVATRCSFLWFVKMSQSMTNMPHAYNGPWHLSILAIIHEHDRPYDTLNFTPFHSKLVRLWHDSRDCRRFCCLSNWMYIWWSLTMNALGSYVTFVGRSLAAVVVLRITFVDEKNVLVFILTWTIITVEMYIFFAWPPFQKMMHVTYYSIWSLRWTHPFINEVVDLRW